MIRRHSDFPNIQGSGADTQLLEKAIQTAYLNGCKRITLLTDSPKNLRNVFMKNTDPKPEPKNGS